MPRKSKSKAQPESPAGHHVSETLEHLKEQLPALKTAAELPTAQEKIAEYEAQPLQEWTQPGEVPLQHPDYKLARYEEPAKQSWVNKRIPPLIGAVARGRGRRITADDSSFAIESDKPLTAGEIDLAQKNGFDDFSEKGDGRVMVADKAEMRKANGDINHVAYALTSRGAGRER